MSDPDFTRPADLWPDPPTSPLDQPPRVWVWTAMTPAERTTRMKELHLWVEWLREQFHLNDTIARCWYLHQDAVEHLTALYLGWVRTYTQEPEPGRALVETEWISTLHSLTPYIDLTACATQHDPYAMPRPRPLRPENQDDFARHLKELADRPVLHPAQAEADRLAQITNPPL